ncbi:MAG: MarR family transcriptional regulator [Eubacterium sp.]|nr:MarR family transcriptional regulator [Eubacterium sp.]
MLDEIKESIMSYYEVYFGIGAIYEKLAKAHGLTSSSLFVLHIIHEYPEQCTQHFICEKLLYPKQTVNTILDSFEKKGYILKKVSNYDKRNKTILLTEAGQKYADSILSNMLHLEEAAFMNMGADERKAMLNGERAFLDQLTRMLDSFIQAK